MHRQNHHNLKTALHKARIAEMGTLPRNRQETIAYLSSLEDSDTIVKTDAKNEIVMIFDVHNFKLLNKDSFCDDTFKYCAKDFYQLYSFQVYKDGSYLPVCHFLLPNQKTTTYVKIEREWSAF